jgi:predicted amidohydrolase YtcJ
MEWGPDTDGTDHLITRSVKAFYDGALGSRGARLLDDYSDMPGHRGVSGEEYGFDEELVAEMMAAGFQANVHAIGDAGNRETLDFFARVIGRYPEAADLRNRVAHAQVVHPGDFWRFRELGMVASVQPPHAMEDMSWAVDRLGPQRVLGAYAWRSFRLIRVPLVFSSDLPGSDHDIFYGLQSAITRRDKELRPDGGWYPGQRMTSEEAVRGYTTWGAWASFVERERGALIPGLWADITVMNIDPLVVGHTDPDRLAEGRILLTIVGGRIVYEAN